MALRIDEAQELRGTLTVEGLTYAPMLDGETETDNVTMPEKWLPTLVTFKDFVANDPAEKLSGPGLGMIVNFMTCIVILGAFDWRIPLDPVMLR